MSKEQITHQTLEAGTSARSRSVAERRTRYEAEVERQELQAELSDARHAAERSNLELDAAEKLRLRTAAELDRVRRAKALAEAERTRLEEELSAARQAAERVGLELEAAVRAGAESSSQLEETRREKATVEAERERLASQLGDALSTVQQSRLKLDNAARTHSQTVSELASLRDAQAEADALHQRRESELSEARTLLSDADASVSRLEGDLIEALTAAQDSRLGLEAAERAREESTIQVDEMRRTQAEAEAVHDALQRELKESRYEVRRLNRRLDERGMKVRFLQNEREKLLADAHRVSSSKSWRWGHWLARLFGLRKRRGSSAVDHLVRRLEDDTWRHLVPPTAAHGTSAEAKQPIASARTRPLPSAGLGAADRLTIGFIEPHLLAVGGIRRVLETGNHLVERGHSVKIYLPEGQERRCDWMPCHPEVKWFSEGEEDELDVLIFNHEPQWYLLESFKRARYRVFLALSYSRAYEKSGSWESLRSGVDLRLANSRWTADCIEQEMGIRPPVVPTGVNRDLFHPVELKKTYPVLCAGDSRPWKGTETIERACEILDLPLERMKGKNLPQEKLADLFGRSEVFAVGSPIDGFGQPGLEALACGLPLVTTDNGGCREYAVHEETALIVPPGDPAAMADAIRRVREDRSLRTRLIANGLEICRNGFTWEAAAEGLERELVALVAGRTKSLRQSEDLALRAPEPEPRISIVVLTWNQLELTQRCVESIRQNTDVPYELIMVDNGSTKDGAASYTRLAADVAILNSTNRGFSAGLNQGLERARGDFVFFLNNDTKLPPKWASPLISTMERNPSIGMVLPAVTAAPNQATVRDEPGEEIVILPPYKEPPSGIALLMRTSVARELDGWSEEYEVASGEDTDLCFTVWTNGLDVVLDERVLIDHVGKASAKHLPDQKERWITNRHVFLDKWTGSLDELPKLDSCPAQVFDANKDVARAVAFWMQRYFRKKDGRGPRLGAKNGGAPAEAAAAVVASPQIRGAAGPLAITNSTVTMAERHTPAVAAPGPLQMPVRLTWRAVRWLVPSSTRARLYKKHRHRYERAFPERRKAP